MLLEFWYIFITLFTPHIIITLKTFTPLPLLYNPVAATQHGAPKSVHSLGLGDVKYLPYVACPMNIFASTWGTILTERLGKRGIE